MIDYDLIGKRIKNIRTQHDMTQEQLAEYSGITPGYLSKIEAGTKQPSLEVLMAIAYSFGVSLDDLVYSNTHLDNFGVTKRMIMKAIDECTTNEQNMIYSMLEHFLLYLAEHGIRI